MNHDAGRVEPGVNENEQEMVFYSQQLDGGEVPDYGAEMRDNLGISCDGERIWGSESYSASTGIFRTEEEEEGFLAGEETSIWNLSDSSPGVAAGEYHLLCERWRLSGMGDAYEAGEEEGLRRNEAYDREGM